MDLNIFFDAYIADSLITKSMQVCLVLSLASNFDIFFYNINYSQLLNLYFPANSFKSSKKKIFQ